MNGYGIHGLVINIFLGSFVHMQRLPWISYSLLNMLIFIHSLIPGSLHWKFSKSIFLLLYSLSKVLLSLQMLYIMSCTTSSCLRACWLSFCHTPKPWVFCWVKYYSIQPCLSAVSGTLNYCLQKQALKIPMSLFWMAIDHFKLCNPISL